MWLRILGLPDGVPSWWNAVDLPDDGDRAAVLDDVLRHRFPDYHFTVDGFPLSQATAGTQRLSASSMIVARPGAPRNPHRRHGPEIALVVEDGPDAGLLAPLPRSGLSVGRSRADLLVADPFLSAPDFRAEVAPDGVRIVPLPSTGPPSGSANRRPARVGAGTAPWLRGGSTFRLVRGRPDPQPQMDGMPELVLDPGPHPSRPNALLQAIMALGPLVIGVVMAAVTGLWYFLLFSLVSVGVTAAMWTQHRRARTRHGRRIREAAEIIRLRLESLAPPPGSLALAARALGPDRFGTSRPPGGPPVVRWGTGTAELPVSAGHDDPDWSAWSRKALPIVSVLHPDAVTRVVGRRSTLEAVSAWLTVQLCRDAAASGRGILIRTASGCRELGVGLAAPTGTVIDHPGTAAGPVPAGWHRVMLLGPDTDQGEQSAGDWLDLEEGRATVAGLDYDGFAWHGVSDRTASWLVDELGAAPAPRGLRKSPSMPLPAMGFAGSSAASLSCPLSGEPGPIHLDLVTHGPHALIAGTTGSGKSELLLTALVGLAAGYPPAEVAFVLMDFKGGSSFASLGRLPHTMSVETNLVEAESLRTLDALTAELRRREELFLTAGCSDYAAFRAQRPQAPLPRLVIAIDELRVLVEDHPQAAALLARLAATGRSLGFHLLLATQRAQGAVGPDVRSNLGTVVCLRTATEQESWDLLGTPKAHTIDAGSPGTAYLRHGGARPRLFQAGRFSAAPGPPMMVPWAGTSDSAPDDATRADWPSVASRVARTVRELGLETPTPIVTPALPDRWSPTTAGHQSTPGDVVVGLADYPRRCRQEPVTWVPGRDGPAAWIGTAPGGLDDAARSVLGQMARNPGSAPEWRTVVLGAHVRETEGQAGATTTWSPGDTDPHLLATLLDEFRADLATGARIRVVVTAWGRWAGLRVGTGFDTVEERLSLLIRDHPPARLAVALFGGRELAGGRILGLVPNRFYIPAGSTPEHKMVWPTLQRVRDIPGRAVMVTGEHPAPGIVVQLAMETSAPPTPASE